MFIPRRLAKLVRESTWLSAAQADLACRDGRAHTAAGESAPDSLVFPDDVVFLDGNLLTPREAQVIAVLNKPTSVTCTVRDPRGKSDLSPWLRQMPPGMFPVGRLDRATTGLLLFTTDGDLASAITRPEHHLDKLYWLWLDEPLEDNDPRLAALLTGVEIRGSRARAASVHIQHRTESCTELMVVLREGKNRQLRRMCRTLDLRLIHIHRKQIGPIAAPALDLGAWRLLRDEESEQLWRAVGGPARIRGRRVSALQNLARERRAAGSPHLRLEAWLEAYFGRSQGTPASERSATG